MARPVAYRLLASSLAAAVVAFAVPDSVQAWSLNVHVHGAGIVDEITPENATYCDTTLLNGTTPRSNGSVFECWNSKDYPNGWVIELQASVPADYAQYGWYVQKWVDGTSSEQINCDPQNTTGDHFSTNCKFQIWGNRWVDVYFRDDTAPPVSLESTGPENDSVTTSTSASFGFSSTDPNATLQCRLNGTSDDFAPCPSPKSYTTLGQGDYTFFVRAVDPSGNPSAAKSRHWKIDTEAPSVSLTNGPVADQQTEDPNATFSWDANDFTTLTVTCTLDGKTEACASGKAYVGLADGAHTFTVTATDQVGHATSVSRTWVVDRFAPQTTITGGPASGARINADPTFTFSASEPATFTCRVDNGTAAACTSPFSVTGLAEGQHTLEVTASDPYGHTDTTPDSRTWTLDKTAPNTLVYDGPADGSTTAARTSTFVFGADDPSAAFECRFDAEMFAPCTSPQTRLLDDGTHTFEVRARDAAGNVDASPATRTWRINTGDTDGDGVNDASDCRPADAAIHPGAFDVPGNGIDEDCSGADSPVPDADGDGVNAGPDCNDANTAIHPGATDLPANGIDEDCDGRDANFTVAAGGIIYQWFTRAGSTWPMQLLLTKVAVGSTVRITCRGAKNKCFFRSKVIKGSGKTLDLRKIVFRAKRKAGPTPKKLHAGAVLTIQITAPGTASRAVAFHVRRGNNPPTGGRFACRQPDGQVMQCA